ncbi:MAG TPA: hypothetical protein VMT00_10545 [Thermoanaerobaculia bacterium]|nr:hypothetical protein [Thermoanaerobaculia bacterium]
MQTESAPAVPTPLLSAEAIDDRFDRLQKKLVGQWRRIGPMNQVEQTIVVVSSISLELNVSGSLMQAYALEGLEEEARTALAGRELDVE